MKKILIYVEILAVIILAACLIGSEVTGNEDDYKKALSEIQLLTDNMAKGNLSIKEIDKVISTEIKILENDNPKRIELTTNNYSISFIYKTENDKKNDVQPDLVRLHLRKIGGVHISDLVKIFGKWKHRRISKQSLVSFRYPKDMTENYKVQVSILGVIYLKDKVSRLDLSVPFPWSS